jgi:hypothetical protein
MQDIAPELAVRQRTAMEFADRLDSLVGLSEDAEPQNNHCHDKQGRAKEGDQ